MATPWKVTPDWLGQTAAVLACGPSMTRSDAEAVHGRCKVIAVNNTGIATENDGKLEPALAPWADILFASDSKWWIHYEAQALKFAGRKVSLSKAVKSKDVFCLELSTQIPFDPRPTHLASGGNSGYQAVHLAAHLGAKRIILLGFDMRQAPDGRRHWFGAHPGRLNSKGNFVGWVRAFDRLAPALAARHVEVINCSRVTALKAFRRATLETILHGLPVRETTAPGHAASA